MISEEIVEFVHIKNDLEDELFYESNFRLALEEYVNTNQKFLEDIQEFLIKAKERRNA